ncbi:MAG: ABC transporter ATP-binding protein [Planctomycetota bacterium]
MPNDVLIEVDHVSKKFCRGLKRALWYGVRDIGAELLGRNGRYEELRPGEFWAVQDVSFQVRRGECLGLIGPNGAGKSTLLKMLNGLIKPDRGRIAMRGRIGALIELGTGFNPILTGRENIYNNAAVLGLSKREVDRKLSEIIEFAELPGDALDAPVQSYSSGMKVRLGFAVAAHMEPDVLMIDEILAVGDVGFRGRCYNRIAQVASRTAVILVSHSMMQVARLGTTAVVMHSGHDVFQGAPSDAVQHYYSLFANRTDAARIGTGEVRIARVAFFNARGEETADLSYGERVTVRLELQAQSAVDGLVLDIGFRTVGDEVVAQCNNFVKPVPLSIGAGQSMMVEAIIDRFTLNPGAYRVAVCALSADMTVHFDWLYTAAVISVRNGRPAGAGQQFLAQWRTEPLCHAQVGVT